MHDFVSLVLRRYFEATGWNEHNSYLNLTASSRAILDFSVPPGLNLRISKSPTPPFFTSYSLRALPTLSGSVGYIFTSCDNPVNIGGASGSVRLKDVVERFRTFDFPKRPEGKDAVWQGGQRVDTRDYLMYGCLYIPTSRLDALYTTRLSRTWQAVVAAISDPRPLSSSSSSGATPTSGGPPALPGASNVTINLQNDTGRCCTEYSYSADDGMWGIRTLYNFGSPSSEKPASGMGSAGVSGSTEKDDGRQKRIDEEEAIEGGLRGHFSAGAEMYFSAREKSAGLSTGVRFTTLPDQSLVSPSLASSPYSQNVPYYPSQPPTTITATFNPMMGHISTAYAARMSRNFSVCSRFDFNMYSYDSDITLGAEWWMRSRPRPLHTIAPQTRDPFYQEASSKPKPVPAPSDHDDTTSSQSSLSSGLPEADVTEASSKAHMLNAGNPNGLNAASGFSGEEREERELSAQWKRKPAAWSLNKRVGEEDVDRIDGVSSPAITAREEKGREEVKQDEGIIGVVKARVGANADVALMWEGRLYNCLVSLGVVADLGSRLRPIRAVGLDLQYFSSSDAE